MYSTYLRYLLHLHRHKIVLLGFFCVLATWGFSQTVQERSKGFTPNLPNYDDRLLHYGFSLGINSARFILAQSDFYVQNLGDSIRSANTFGSPGFNLGLILNLRLHYNFDVRIQPGVGFYNRGIKFETKNTTFTQNVETAVIEFPILLKYKSDRKKNFSMYLIGGIKPGFATFYKRQERRPDQISTNNFDLCIDYGFGFSIYYPFFRFSSEIRFSHGVLNMNIPDASSPYSKMVQRLTTHTVTWYIIFE
ncbi:MAG: PorT family protein [Cytophagales bacterium]|nr:PorT family protein [Cytophagales bacterium]